MNKWTKISAIVAIIIFASFIWLCILWLNFLRTPLITADKSAVAITLQSGASVKALARQLHNKDLLARPKFFVFLARLRGDTRTLQSGDYKIEPGTTPIQLLNKLVSGDVILRSFTIVDGWTFHDMINALEQNPSIVHTLKGLTDPQIMQKIGVPGEIPEGRFYPDTYKFSGGVKDVDILRSAYKLMQSKLNAAWNNRAADAPYSCQYKALIAASIIEKEAAVPSERPIISGVIKRRLKKNMYLQMDPTVIYGLGDSYKGDLTVKDLRRNTPYNTYLHKRLPPTPICIPSIDAFEAALHPQAGKELYFVAKGDGTHEFSATLKEQDAAIRKYQLKKNPKKSS